MKREAGYIIVGILSVAACAGIAFITENIWTGFFAGFIFGIIYLLILDRKMIQSLDKSGHKTTARVLITALVLAQCYASYVIYDRSQFAENNLHQTRSNIDEGVSKLRTQEVLLKTLQHYYSQSDQTEATIASAFREVMGDRLNPDGTVDMTEPGVRTDIQFGYEIISPDEVSITASATIGKGVNPDFVNVSSQTGKYQAVATLTPNGIDYEREN